MDDKPDMTPVSCNDECGRRVPRCELGNEGWEWLPITNRYRCVDCWRALKEINQHAN